METAGKAENPANTGASAWSRPISTRLPPRSRTMLRLTQTPARTTPASLLKLSFHFEGNLRSRSSRCTRSPVQHLPVQRLHHRRIAVLVGVRERVTPRRNRATQLLPLGGVEPRRVADAVERLRLRELLVDERDDMAPRREHPREVLCCGRRRMKNIVARESKRTIAKVNVPVLPDF